MASMDDANHDESGEAAPSHGGSDFGPPVSEFGPPVDAFGPPTGESGPVGWQPADASDRPSVGWQPADAPDRPSVGWQPADGQDRPSVGWQPADAPATPAPPAQYRAPDSTGSRETVRAPAPDPRRAPAPETVRYTDQGQQGSDQGTWWQQGATPQAPGQQPHGQASQGHQQVSQRPPTGPRPVAGQSTGPRETPRSLWDDDDLAKKLQAPREPAQAAKGSPGGSLWDDDDLAEQFGPARTAAPSSDRGGRGRGVLIGGVIAVVLVIAVIAVVAVLLTRKGGNPTPTAQNPPSSAPSALSCQNYSNGTTTTGNGPGNTASGSGAILGFEHAFYTDRSAVKAKSFAVPGKLDVSQDVIDSYPAGTTYCLNITQLTPTTYNVTITEHQPSKPGIDYTGLIDVQNVDGKFLVASPQHK
ncbi:hypothetical protein KO481_09095 [Nocardia sp. NEAU-G5]|uniref:DUF8176 domain-containing protein n=1 Tax=Nocardia albiluteola TaxID=2842303 RepID=A0ABS6AVV9_9NOCA|nr:hypothetical protein [Nocardia albiluteola]MBU3061680.1 hypothetical protein [Nocardia albiluteola]